MLRLNAIHAVEEVTTAATAILRQFAVFENEPLTKDQSNSLGTLAVNCRLLMVECQATVAQIELIRGVEWRDTKGLLDHVKRHRDGAQ